MNNELVHEEPNFWIFMLSLVLVAVSLSLIASGRIGLEPTHNTESKPLPMQEEPASEVHTNESVYRLI